uniref:Uncharacterized protein n=1 Tax=Oryza brachyantha TaxID=4533 RepID=J3LTR7_ORYBR
MFAGAPPLAGRKSPPNSHKSAVQTSPASPINISRNIQPNTTNLHSFESYAPCLKSGENRSPIGATDCEKIGCKSGGEAHFGGQVREAEQPIQLGGGGGGGNRGGGGGWAAIRGMGWRAPPTVGWATIGRLRFNVGRVGWRSVGWPPRPIRARHWGLPVIATPPTI